ncbi:unnamed protein product [Blepharisma stoltei]|uniref:Porin n=1 Tax=Blepharisma stoltei TaxID=1481888 RepID=A0AAU9JC62_9CILI|nr:unnamed protein product [Blepharisma stoltei]
MAKLENYQNLTKTHKDILDNGFCYKKDVQVNLYANIIGKLPGKLSIWHLEKDPFKKVSAFSRLSYQYDDLTFKNQLNTFLNHKFICEFAPSDNQNVKLRAELNSNLRESYFNRNSLILDCNYPNFNGSLSITNNCILKLTSVIGSKFGIGFDAAYDALKPHFPIYNGALWWKNDSFNVVVKHQSMNQDIYELGTVYVYGFTELNKTKIACEMKKEPNKDPELRFALMRNLTKNSSAKFRLAGNEVAGSLKVKVNPHLTVITSANLRNMPLLSPENTEFGVKLKLNF